MDDSGNPADATVLRAPGHGPSPAVVESFSVFYREFVPRLVAFLLCHGTSLPEAADVAQDTMIKAFRYWDTIENPPAWARTVASRELVGRFARIEAAPLDELPERTVLLPADLDVTEFAERHEVLRLIASLPPRQRQVLAWTFDGYEPEEIAEQLSITSEAVRSSLLKARRSLGRRLAQERSDDD